MLGVSTNIVIRIILIISLVELGIMMSLSYFELSSGLNAFIDVIALTLISAPIIFLKIIRPYINQHVKDIQKIHHLAHHDSLTNLANRRKLMDYFNSQIARVDGSQFYGAILYFDLDGFKEINDSHGHAAGDEILIQVANRLNSFVRNNDIVSRVGGDEFVMYLRHLDSDRDNAIRKAQDTAIRIQESLGNKVLFDKQELVISASIGINLIDYDSMEKLEQGMLEADKAMYTAKIGKKGSISVYENADFSES